MKRALLLLCILLPLLFGAAIVCDTLQTKTAMRYRQQLEPLRRQLLAGDFEGAWDAQRLLHASWQGDEPWLNYLISHHHTRAVNTALLHLSTALEQGWDLEALRALDELDDALGDVEKSDAPSWQNLL